MKESINMHTLKATLELLSQQNSDHSPVEEEFVKRLWVFIQNLQFDNPDYEKYEKELKKIFFERGVPFPIVCENLEAIENLFLSDSSQHSSENIHHLFKILKNRLAHFYLIEEAKSFKIIEVGHFKEKTLYHIHALWQNNLRDAIVHDTIDEIPMYDSQMCPFSNALKYPESRMICHELNICDYLINVHRKLHELTSTFIYLMSNQHYKSAYYIFQQIKEVSEKLLNLTAILYFNAQIDRASSFKRYLQLHLEKREPLYIALLDINSMGLINKFYNPKTGDRVLELVANVLKQIYHIYQSQMLYVKGTGGDFYIMFEKCDLETVQKILQQFASLMEEKSSKDSSLPEFNVDMAILKLQPPIHMNLEELTILYSYLKEKLKEESSPLYLTDEQSQENALSWISNHYRHIKKLKDLMEDHGIEIFLQSINHTKYPDKIHAYEVLARIQDNGVYIPAGNFIDLLIETGVIETFDLLVLERIIYHKDLLHAIGNTFFINVSSTSITSDRYIERLIEAIRGPLVGIEIIVELTEQLLLENIGRVVQLHKEHNLIFAIDDFGTGYSSLQTVIRLAEKGVVQYLKIDGTLTKHIEDSESTRKILKVITEMSHSLGLEAIIECIESPSQLNLCSEMGIEYGQGYYLTKPKNILEIYLDVQNNAPIMNLEFPKEGDKMD